MPKFYGLPKIHKKETPLRPIVSSIGSVSYATSKELARILKPLVGRSPYPVHSNQDLLEDLRSLEVGERMNVLCLLMSRHCSHQFQSSLPLMSSKITRRRPRSQAENINVCQSYHKPSNSAWVAHILLSRAGSMSNRKVQLWAPPSALLLPTCIWRTWN